MARRIGLEVTIRAWYIGEDADEAPDYTAVDDSISLALPSLESKFLVMPKMLEGMTVAVIDAHHAGVRRWRDEQFAARKQAEEKQRMLDLWGAQSRQDDGIVATIRYGDQVATLGFDGTPEPEIDDTPAYDTMPEAQLTALGVDMPAGYTVMQRADGRFTWLRAWNAGLVEVGDPLDTLNAVAESAWDHVRTLKGSDYRKSHTPPDLIDAGYWIEYRPTLDHDKPSTWVWARDLSEGGREYGAPYATRVETIADARRMMSAQVAPSTNGHVPESAQTQAKPEFLASGVSRHIHIMANLLTVPAHDGNFLSCLADATAEELREALDQLPKENTKTKRQKIESRLRALEREAA